MSKTERALHEPGLADAPDDAPFVETSAEQDGARDEFVEGDTLDALDAQPPSNGDLPAPTMGFAPPVPDESPSESTGNGHADADDLHDQGRVDDHQTDDHQTDDDRADDDRADDDRADQGESEEARVDDAKIEDSEVDVARADQDAVDDTHIGDARVDDDEVDDAEVDVAMVDDDEVDAARLDEAQIDEAQIDDAGVDDDEVGDAQVDDDEVGDAQIDDDEVGDVTGGLLTEDGADPDLLSNEELPEPGGAEGLDVDVVDDIDPGVARSIGELFDDEPDGTPAGLPAPPADAGRDTERSDPSGDQDHHGVQATGIPGEALKVSPPGTDVLEELRTARVDGPTVEVAPQDDDTGYNVRRPQRLRDYDPAPIPIPAKVPRLLGRKPRVRKVTRVVRHVDPWSVFKIAIIANLVLYVILLTAGVLLWNVANATGTVDNVERFFESFGWSSFEFNGGEIYHSAWIAGLFLVVGLTGAAVLLATLFNLITDLVGGMRFTVLEEEVVETRTSPMRRFVVRRPEPEVPAIDHDESGAIVREAVVDDSGAIVRRTR